MFAVLEIVFYYGYLNVTEAGGCFFLILSGELLVNSLWKRKKEEKRMIQHGIWQEEEDEDEQEEYGQLRQEMYQNLGERKDFFAEERIEETRCLTDVQEPCGMRLIYIQPEGNAGEVPQVFPDIYIGTDAVTVGKLQGQCEVQLNASTVSRIHARMEYRKGIGYIRDLNSRNGTFLKWRTFRAAGAAHLYRRSADCLCRCSVSGGSCAYTVLSVASIRFCSLHWET